MNKIRAPTMNFKWEQPPVMPFITPPGYARNDLYKDLEISAPQRAKITFETF